MRVADEIQIAQVEVTLVSGALVAAGEAIVRRNQVVSLEEVRYTWSVANSDQIRYVEMALTCDMEYLTDVIGYIFGGQSAKFFGRWMHMTRHAVGGGEAFAQEADYTGHAKLYRLVVPAQLALIAAQTLGSGSNTIIAEVYYHEVDMGRNEMASLYNRWTRSRNVR